jgi:acid stress chaperone HdeA
VSKRLAALLGACACALALVSGCTNNGSGDSSCGDFLSMTDQGKDAAVARMLKDRNGRNASTGDVEAKRVAIVGLCQAPGKQSAKISDLA